MNTLNKRAIIQAALPLLRFERITSLFFVQDGETIEEFSAQLGVPISNRSLPTTLVAGNRVANSHEIWLYPDGTLHRYLWTATWETFDGCSQWHYVGPATEEDVSLEDLKEQIESYIYSDSDMDDWEDDEGGR